jgi:hypothetical protein
MYKKVLLLWNLTKAQHFWPCVVVFLKDSLSCLCLLSKRMACFCFSPLSEVVQIIYCFVALLSVHRLPINVFSSPVKPITSSQSVYCTVLLYCNCYPSSLFLSVCLPSRAFFGYSGTWKDPRVVLKMYSYSTRYSTYLEFSAQRFKIALTRSSSW